MVSSVSCLLPHVFTLPEYSTCPEYSTVPALTRCTSLSLHLGKTYPPSKRSFRIIYVHLAKDGIRKLPHNTNSLLITTKAFGFRRLVFGVAASVSIRQLTRVEIQLTAPTWVMQEVCCLLICNKKASMDSLCLIIHRYVSSYIHLFENIACLAFALS